MIELVPLGVPVMQALVAGDLDTASRQAGAPLTPYLVGEGWLWRIRLEQVASSTRGPGVDRARGGRRGDR